MLLRFRGEAAAGLVGLGGRGAGATARRSVGAGSKLGAGARLAFLRRGGGSVVTVEGRHLGATVFATPRLDRLAFRLAIGARGAGDGAGGGVLASNGEGRTMS